MLQTSHSFRPDARDLNGSISLSEILSALSYALDLTEGAVPGHALRSCLLGMRLAAEAKLTPGQTGSLYFASLLKDVGRSSHAPHDTAAPAADQKYRHPLPRPSVAGMRTLWRNVLTEIEATGPESLPGIGILPLASEQERATPRSGRGARIIRKLGLGETAAEAVRNLDERWDGRGSPDRLAGEQIPLLSRLCAVAQHLDYVAIQRGEQGAIESLKAGSGAWFDPQVVRMAISLDWKGTLWNQCRPEDSREDTRQAVLDLDNRQTHLVESGRIDQICEAFADVVDAKSHFTFRHSLGVAEAAFGIAQNMGMPGGRTQLVRRAALLHDIGKLSVSNRILDKKTGLDSDEWSAVYQHPSITRLILERVAPFREIAIIAGEHHEKLDGSGYPHRLEGRHLSLESRIISVADVYGALSEDRPYRPGLMLDEILAIMAKLVPHQLDADCYNALVSVVSSKRDLSYRYGSHPPGSPMVYAI